MKTNILKSKSAILILFMILALCLDISFADATDIDKGIEYYQNADPDKARTIFERLVKQGNNAEIRETALVYLALVEMAFRNEDEADNYLFKLLLSNPSFKLENVEDADPEIRKHFNRIKSKDIIKAIGYYQDADPDKAKHIFERLAKQGNKNETRQIAFVYLALIEIAYGNTTQADAYLTKLLAAEPSFELGNLKDIEDISPELKKRFDQIKSGDKVKSTEKDRIQPTGEISGIRSSYSEGDIVNYTVRGEDNKSLRKMIFRVKKSSVKKTWNVSGTSATHKASFSTVSWEPGTYTYSLLTEDSAGNSGEYTETFILRKRQKPDTTRPSGKVSRIKDSYTEGDTVYYTVSGEDNKSLRKMMFNVKKSSVKKTWDVSGTSATHKSSFSTDGWKAGTHTYSLLTEDSAGNSEKYTGTFVLKKRQRPDTTRPTGKVSRIKNSYTQGDTIYYTVRADDNKSLSKMIFRVKKSSVKKTWNVSGTSATHKASFSTDGWKSGTYSYSLLTEDSAGNSDEHAGTFVLGKKRKPDTTRPTGKVSRIKNSYTQGDTIYYTVRADDNKSLSKMIFRVKKSSVKKTWNVSGRSATRKSSFTTNGWIPGTYTYSLLTEDSAGNHGKRTGTFVITGVISDARPVSAKDISDTGQMKQLISQLKWNIKEYARLVKAKNSGENVREKIPHILNDIVEIAKDIKNIYEESSQKYPEIVDRMDRLIKLYEKKLTDFSRSDK